MLALKFLGRLREVGFVILRVGLGLSFIMHGSGKIFGGPETWTEIGQAMGNWGVNIAPMFWGLCSDLLPSYLRLPWPWPPPCI